MQLLQAAGTGPVAEKFGDALKARRQVVLDWLLDQPGALGAVAAHAPASATGVARVETARGELTHELRLVGENVAEYRIIAPTDTLFAAQGAVAGCLQCLQGLAVAEAERQARLVALTFDPCVPWQCRVVAA
jgi:coenzyme F420-reducing hydrogenase alpha subunit